MSADRELERVVRSWLTEDGREDADRVLNLVLEEVDTTPQRRVSWLARRFPPMNSNVVRFGFAAAVVAIAAIVGFTYFNSNVGTNEPTPTPILTASPSASPTATPVAIPPLPPFGAGSIVPGRYTIAVPGSPVIATITVGEGWTTGGWYIMNPPDFTKQVSFWTVDNVYQDLCDRESLPDAAIGPSVDDLVAALDAQANTDMSRAVDVELGGFAGKRVTIAEAVDITCLDAAVMGPITYFRAAGNRGDVQGRDLERNRLDTLWIIDVEGHRVVISTGQIDPEDADATTTVAGVLDSIEFEVP